MKLIPRISHEILSMYFGKIITILKIAFHYKKKANKFTEEKCKMKC